MISAYTSSLIINLDIIGPRVRKSSARINPSLKKLFLPSINFSITESTCMSTGSSAITINYF